MARKVADIMERDVVQHLEEKLRVTRVDCLAALSGDE